MANIEKIESSLLDLADYVYAHTALKPMSKTLFFVSRMLILLKFSPTLGQQVATGDASLDSELIAREYELVVKRLGLSVDDYDFRQVLVSVEGHLAVMLEHLRSVAEASDNVDVLGLAFNSLLRGKFEAGEGLGTHLTPEEVVLPMCRIALHLAGTRSPGAIVAADITAGTGRFMYHLSGLLRQSPGVGGAEKNFFLFDQSKAHTEFAEINFLLSGQGRPGGQWVQDSLVASEVGALASRCDVLLTNPPFGIGKYTYSAAIAQHLDPRLTAQLGFAKVGDSIDPAWLFVIRNLDLLAAGGVLGIVLPNGIAHSEDLISLLRTYERTAGCRLNVDAVIALPTVTFALGGTVAKTTAVFLSKDSDREELRVATVAHIGFEKSGNKRVADPKGNEFDAVATALCSNLPGIAVTAAKNWRSYARLSPDLISFEARLQKGGALSTPLGELATQIRQFGSTERTKGKLHLHVSILDVDETGLIDLPKCIDQTTVTQPLACKSGDIIISCLNPAIWRAAFIPQIEGATWSCSPEFAIFRPNASDDSSVARLFLSLHQQDVKDRVVSMGRGTSSSRQRVKKTDLNEVEIPVLGISDERIATFMEARQTFYVNRLVETMFLRTIAGSGGPLIEAGASISR